MRILMVGGGSGGHVTPLRAVIRELKNVTNKELDITVVTDRGFFEQTQFLFKDQKNITLKKIFSGKFRRYNNKSLVWHITHLPTVLKNIRDLFYIGLGVLQSVALFIADKPDIVFAKGGFVCLPIGLVSRVFGVPLLIHDSDTHPGLTNRMLSRWAEKIATGMPVKYYPYPATKMVYTGIPVSEDFRIISKEEQAKRKAELGFDNNKPIVLITGGGTGAKTLNDAALDNIEELVEKNWQIILITGKNKSKYAAEVHNRLPDNKKPYFKYYEFTEVAPLALAADVIVTRAGATAMQEFANAAKQVVVVPSPYLTGAHQLKNAQMFLENNAALVLQESELKQPRKLINEIFRAAENKTIGNVLYKIFAKPNAAKELAALILK